jgi:methionyl-tRNA formyltransferase
MNKYKVLYFGTWGYGLAGLKALTSIENVEVIKVFTKWDLSSDNPYLNGVYQLAESKGYNIINSDKRICPKPEFERIILESEPFDFIVSCCFDRIFTQKVLDKPRIKPINIHPSVLPKYRGVKPLENAIIKGEKYTGVTIHELIAEPDAGDILLQRSDIEIPLNSTFGELYENQCEKIKELLIIFFRDPSYYLENKIKQDNAASSQAPRLSIVINSNDRVKDILEKV